jgi:hypothetical protein
VDGLTWLDSVLRDRSVVLLCACSDRATCHLHRIVATDLLDPNKRAEMGLSKRGPTLVHVHLDGTFTDGPNMLASTDEGLPAIQHAFQALAKHRKAADKWRESRLDIFDE